VIAPLLRSLIDAFRRRRRAPSASACARFIGSSLLACGDTHQGCVRGNNEDSLLIDPHAGLLIVADGMGGHSAGEVASRMAVEVIQQALGEPAGGAPGEGSPRPDPPSSARATSLAAAVKQANRQVFEAGCAEASCAGMGTTVAVALVEGHVATYCSVGDSRIYLYRGGGLEQLTVDDSWVQTMQNAGPESFDPTAHGSMRHVLTKVVGAFPEIDCTVGECALGRGDSLLLCTDGLHGLVSDESIRGCFAESQSPQRVVSALIGRAIAAGGLDNVTVLVAQCTG
jgi:protein phosphatase